MHHDQEARSRADLTPSDQIDFDPTKLEFSLPDFDSDRLLQFAQLVEPFDTSLLDDRLERVVNGCYRSDRDLIVSCDDTEDWPAWTDEYRYELGPDPLRDRHDDAENLPEKFRESPRFAKLMNTLLSMGFVVSAVADGFLVISLKEGSAHEHGTYGSRWRDRGDGA